MRNSEEVVLITGASGGVGRAAARAFARDGARVGLLARGRDGLEAARREVERLGGRGLVLQADVADWRQVEDAAKRLEEAFGPIDVWVNNAMVTVMSPVKETREEEFKRATEVTYLGVVYGTLAALRRMLPRDRGTIVQVSSALAFRSIPLQAAYCAAKHAVVGFTESLRSELIHDRSRVHVTMVHLPGLNTPQFTWSKSRVSRHPQPIPPFYQPEVAADAIAWAARHRRRELSVGHRTLMAIWGNRLAPGYLDRRLAESAYSRQQTSELIPPDRQNNLWEPLPGDPGAHGPFDDRARKRSLELWLAKHRGAAAAGAAAALLLPRLLRSAASARSRRACPRRNTRAAGRP